MPEYVAIAHGETTAWAANAKLGNSTADMSGMLFQGETWSRLSLPSLSHVSAVCDVNAPQSSNLVAGSLVTWGGGKEALGDYLGSTSSAYMFSFKHRAWIYTRQAVVGNSGLRSAAPGAFSLPAARKGHRLLQLRQPFGLIDDSDYLQAKLFKLSGSAFGDSLSLNSLQLLSTEGHMQMGTGKVRNFLFGGVTEDGQVLGDVRTFDFESGALAGEADDCPPAAQQGAYECSPQINWNPDMNECDTVLRASKLHLITLADYGLTDADLLTCSMPKPAGRMYHSLSSYRNAEGRQCVLVYGGSDGVNIFGDLWEHCPLQNVYAPILWADRTAWLSNVPATTIHKRYLHAAFIHNNHLVVYGGLPNNVRAMSDFWGVDLQSKEHFHPAFTTVGASELIYATEHLASNVSIDDWTSVQQLQALSALDANQIWRAGAAAATVVLNAEHVEAAATADLRRLDVAALVIGGYARELENPHDSFLLVSNGSATCAAGKAGSGIWLHEAGRFDCVACAAGKFSFGGTNACIECEAGKYLPAVGATQCFACPSGKFGTATGGLNESSVCHACPAGFVANKDGSTSCTGCNSGEYAPSLGSTVCKACELGRYSASKNSTHCDICAPGEFSDALAATKCTLCDAGRFNPLVERTACFACPQGTHQAAQNATSCEACEPGKVGTIRAATSVSACTPCAPGFYTDTRAASACLPCQAGRASSISAANSSDVCLACPRGQFASSPGHEVCSTCSIGRYSSERAATLCEACSEGKYGVLTGQKSEALACTSCPSHRPRSQEASIGVSSCASCTNGTVLVSSLALPPACVPCPAGFVKGIDSPELVDMPPVSMSNSPGKQQFGIFEAYNDPRQVLRVNFNHTIYESEPVCLPCPRGKYSTEGSTTCHECPPATYSGFGSHGCTPCSSLALCPAGPNGQLCSGHGACFMGGCKCYPGWNTTSDCSQGQCSGSNCQTAPIMTLLSNLLILEYGNPNYLQFSDPRAFTAETAPAQCAALTQSANSSTALVELIITSTNKVSVDISFEGIDISQENVDLTLWSSAGPSSSSPADTSLCPAPPQPNIQNGPLESFQVLRENYLLEFQPGRYVIRLQIETKLPGHQTACKELHLKFAAATSSSDLFLMINPAPSQESKITFLSVEGNSFTAQRFAVQSVELVAGENQVVPFLPPLQQNMQHSDQSMDFVLVVGSDFTVDEIKLWAVQLLDVFSAALDRSASLRVAIAVDNPTTALTSLQILWPLSSDIYGAYMAFQSFVSNSYQQRSSGTRGKLLDALYRFELWGVRMDKSQPFPARLIMLLEKNSGPLSNLSTTANPFQLHVAALQNLAQLVMMSSSQTDVQRENQFQNRPSTGLTPINMEDVYTSVLSILDIYVACTASALTLQHQDLLQDLEQHQLICGSGSMVKAEAFNFTCTNCGTVAAGSTLALFALEAGFDVVVAGFNPISIKVKLFDSSNQCSPSQLQEVQHSTRVAALARSASASGVPTSTAPTVAQLYQKWNAAVSSQSPSQTASLAWTGGLSSFNENSTMASYWLAAHTTAVWTSPAAHSVLDRTRVSWTQIDTSELPPIDQNLRIRNAALVLGRVQGAQADDKHMSAASSVELAQEHARPIFVRGYSRVKDLSVNERIREHSLELWVSFLPVPHTVVDFPTARQDPSPSSRRHQASWGSGSSRRMQTWADWSQQEDSYFSDILGWSTVDALPGMATVRERAFSASVYNTVDTPSELCNASSHISSTRSCISTVKANDTDMVRVLKLNLNGADEWRFAAATYVPQSPIAVATVRLVYRADGDSSAQFYDIGVGEIPEASCSVSDGFVAAYKKLPRIKSEIPSVLGDEADYADMQPVQRLQVTMNGTYYADSSLINASTVQTIRNASFGESFIERPGVSLNTYYAYQQFVAHALREEQCPAGFACFNNTVMRCGKFGSDVFSRGGQSSCTACRQGFACYNGVAYACPTGYFRNQTARTCTTCDTSSGVACKSGVRLSSCKPGSYFPVGESGVVAPSSCVACPAGKFSEVQAATQCRSCQPGKFSHPGQTSCQNCVAGRYADGVYMARREPVLGGQAGTPCLACPAGKYSAMDGMSKCADCSAGEYSQVEASTVCVGLSAPAAFVEARDGTPEGFFSRGAIPTHWLFRQPACPRLSNISTAGQAFGPATLAPGLVHTITDSFAATSSWLGGAAAQAAVTYRELESQNELITPIMKIGAGSVLDVHKLTTLQSDGSMSLGTHLSPRDLRLPEHIFYGQEGTPVEAQQASEEIRWRFMRSPTDLPTNSSAVCEELAGMLAADLQTPVFVQSDRCNTSSDLYCTSPGSITGSDEIGSFIAQLPLAVIQARAQIAILSAGIDMAESLQAQADKLQQLKPNVRVMLSWHKAMLALLPVDMLSAAPLSWTDVLLAAAGSDTQHPVSDHDLEDLILQDTFDRRNATWAEQFVLQSPAFSTALSAGRGTQTPCSFGQNRLHQAVVSALTLPSQQFEMHSAPSWSGTLRAKSHAQVEISEYTRSGPNALVASNRLLELFRFSLNQQQVAADAVALAALAKSTMPLSHDLDEFVELSATRVKSQIDALDANSLSSSSVQVTSCETKQASVPHLRFLLEKRLEGLIRSLEHLYGGLSSFALYVMAHVPPALRDSVSSEIRTQDLGHFNQKALPILSHSSTLNLTFGLASGVSVEVQPAFVVQRPKCSHRTRCSMFVPQALLQLTQAHISSAPGGLLQSAAVGSVPAASTNHPEYGSPWQNSTLLSSIAEDWYFETSWLELPVKSCLCQKL